MLSYVSIPVIESQSISCYVKVPIDHPLTFYKRVTKEDIKTFDYLMTILPSKLESVI
jgi:hypothetical protein